MNDELFYRFSKFGKLLSCVGMIPLSWLTPRCLLWFFNFWFILKTNWFIKQNFIYITGILSLSNVQVGLELSLLIDSYGATYYFLNLKTGRKINLVKWNKWKRIKWYLQSL